MQDFWSPSRELVRGPALGGWAGSRYPYHETAADVTISAPTTWNDVQGFHRVGKLTINASQTLTIGISPFFIFADEIVFGGTDSIIDASGAPGTSAATAFSATSFARGGTAVQTNGKAQGGCGGGILIVVARKISGAAGVIRANGGAAGGNTTNASAISSIGGQGALSSLFDGTTQQAWLGNFAVGVLLTEGGKNGAGSAQGQGGGSGGGSGSGTNAGAGGSGIAGGGGVNLAGSSATAGQDCRPVISPQQILYLASIGCLGGGGGCGGVHTTGSNNGAGGGGGGAVLVYVIDLAVTPTLSATGGALFGSGLAGGAGYAQIIDLR